MTHPGWGEDFVQGGPSPQPTCAAQPPGRPSPGAPVRHGQDKFLYKETFLSVQMGGLSKHFSLWALKWSGVAGLAGSPGLRCRWAGSKQSSSPSFCPRPGEAELFSLTGPLAFLRSSLCARSYVSGQWGVRGLWPDLV